MLRREQHQGQGRFDIFVFPDPDLGGQRHVHGNEATVRMHPSLRRLRHTSSTRGKVTNSTRHYTCRHNPCFHAADFRRIKMVMVRKYLLRACHAYHLRVVQAEVERHGNIGFRAHIARYALGERREAPHGEANRPSTLPPRR